MDLLVLTDTPDIALDDAGKPKVSRVQIAKTGMFEDPRYGKFAITLRDFSKWIANFASLSKSNGRQGLPLDVDHSPEKTGKTEAAGWITSISAEGNELWAEVEWNSLGVELVSDKRYAYISPSYQKNYRDETGKTHGTALVGAALTNRPFLSMATVSLSSDFEVAREIDAAEQTEPILSMSDSPGEMPDFKNIAERLSLTADADEATILAKVEEVLSQKAPENATIDLAAVAKEQGMIVLSGSDFDSLREGIQAGKDAQKELKDNKFLNAFNASIDAGQAVPAQQEHFRKLYDLDAETTLDVLSNLPKVLNTELRGSGGGGGPAHVDPEFSGSAVDEDRAALDQRAQVLMRENKIDYADAVLLAVDEMGS